MVFKKILTKIINHSYTIIFLFDGPEPPPPLDDGSTIDPPPSLPISNLGIYIVIIIILYIYTYKKKKNA
ncbi:hypothetical protein [Flavobacterium sp.]|uniref:hypothetical protein n=1 Tax=Flavobacterium sp. TaxID=239 RepID=UPI0037501BF9